MPDGCSGNLETGAFGARRYRRAVEPIHTQLPLHMYLWGVLKNPLAQPGDPCRPDVRKSATKAAHVITDPLLDADLIAVHKWLIAQPIDVLLREATDSAVKYVLDGARTWRFDLLDSSVDRDERASVGTKLQYHVIQSLGLKKQPPLDTSIVGVAVEIKGTVRTTWMIPKEGQCEVTLLLRIDAEKNRFACWLMRTHRAWLNEGANQDGKRTPRADALPNYALTVVPWTDLPPEPLKTLGPAQLAEVFDDRGLKLRLGSLFRFLPEVVIPRGSITTVGAGLHDPLRRAREVKDYLLKNDGLVVLVGKWASERALAKKLGFDISDAAWVAVPLHRFQAAGLNPPTPGPRNNNP